MEVRCNCFTKGYIFIALQVLRSVSCSCLGSQPCRPKQYYWCLSAELTGKTTKAKEQTQKAIHRDKRYKAEPDLDIRGQPTKYCEG